MMEGQIQVCGKVTLESHIALNAQVGLVELGVCVDVELPSAGHRVKIEISGTFMVEGEILEVDVGFDGRLLGSTTRPNREAGDSLDGEPAGLHTGETGQIKVTSRKIQPKLVLPPIDFRPVVRQVEVRGADCRTAGKLGAVGTGIDVVELELVTRQTKVALQERNADAVSDSIANLEMPVAVGVGTGTRNGGSHVHHTGKGLGHSHKFRGLRYVCVAKIEMQSEGGIHWNDVTGKSHAGVEVCSGVAMNQGSVVGGEVVARILYSGGKRIPMNASRRIFCGRRQGSVEVVGFEISADRNRG